MVSLYNFQEDFVVSNLFFYLLIKSQVYNFGVVSASIHLLSVCFFLSVQDQSHMCYLYIQYVYLLSYTALNQWGLYWIWVVCHSVFWSFRPAVRHNFVSAQYLEKHYIESN